MPATLALTPKGRDKLAQVLAAARRGAEQGVRAATERLRGSAADGAPAPDREAWLVSAGTAQDGPFAGLNVGVPHGGRFLRHGGMVSLREAIATDPVSVEGPAARVVATTASATRINARTGFFWLTRRRGEQGPSFPFNHAYVQAVENGGVVWTVRPRPGTGGALEPEPGLLTHQVLKTMQPHGMFRRAISVGRAATVEQIDAAIRAAVRPVGRA